MSISNTAFDTSIGLMINLPKTSTMIQRHIITEQPLNLNLFQSLDYNILLITGQLPADPSIPIFNHPIVLNSSDKKYICADIRQYIKNVNVSPYELQQSFYNYVKNGAGLEFELNRIAFQYLWVTDSVNGVSEIRRDLNLACTIYSHLIAESISRFYGIDYLTQLKTSIVAAFFYYNLFNAKNNMSENERDVVAMKICKDLNYKEKDVFDVVEKIQGINTLEDLCGAIKDVTQNISLDTLNKASLLTCISNSWNTVLFNGAKSRELLGISLEHIPTWLAIVYSTLNDKTFKTTQLSIISNKLAARESFNRFNKTAKEIIESIRVIKK